MTLTPERLAELQYFASRRDHPDDWWISHSALLRYGELRALIRAAERGMASLGSFRESVQSAIDRERYKEALERVQAVAYPAPPSDLALRVRAITEPALGFNARPVKS